MKAWLKGGLIGGIIYTILTFVIGVPSGLGCFGDPPSALCSVFNIFLLPFFIIGKIISAKVIPNILRFPSVIIFTFCIGFLVGALIGLLIKKVKK